MYDSLLIDQSMGMNRRREDEGDVKTEVKITKLKKNIRIAKIELIAGFGRDDQGGHG